MGKSSTPSDNSALTREAIIGLGESSFRKNYYPALQKKVTDLEQLNSKYRTLIETLPDILIIGSLENYSLFSPTGKLGNMAEEMLRDETVKAFLNDAVAVSSTEKKLITRNFEFISGGKQVFLEARVNHIEAEEALIIIRDMTEEGISKSRLSEMALQDSLTGLANRRCFEEALSKYMGKYCEKLSLIMLDIDGLKLINDNFGHLAGDQVIVAMSRVLKNTFADSECIARVGGDEFTILLTGREQAEIALLLKKMNSEIDKYNCEYSPITLSASFGYSFLPSGEADSRQLYLDADNNMYQNKLLNESSNRSGIVKSLMKALEAKDGLTKEHVRRLGKLAVLMGTRLALPQDKMDRLELLVKFHDIGKVGIPDSILCKTGPLNANEWKIMKTHSSIGKNIAESSTELKDIAELILLHHESWDGSGYPKGLKGEEIPAECRVLSIIDAYDAMTNYRSYRGVLSPSDAVKEIRANTETQFEAKMVDVFVDLINADLGAEGLVHS